MDIANLIQAHWSEIGLVLTTGLSMYLSYKKRGINGALEVLIEAIGHDGEEHGELKKKIEKKAGRRGFLGFLDAKVKELKRRNKTARVFSDVTEKVAGDSIEKMIEKAVNKI